MDRRAPFAGLIFASCVAASPAAAATYSNLSDFRAAIANAGPGSVILLADGTYTSSSSIVVNRQGTASQPILIAAANIGGATITGTAGITFDVNAAYVEVRGFRFTHSAGTRMPAGSHHCRLMRNVFDVPTASGTNFVTVAGDDHEVGYNTFRDKDNEGQMLTVNGPSGSAMAQRTWIHHNYFLNFLPTGGNNAGALHIGHSGKSLTAAHAIVEYNLFVNTRGENEGSITSKVSSCTYRYNTFGAQAEELSLRHGNNMQVYGNFFIGSQGGLRIFGDDHRIYNNYFEGNLKAIHLGNGDCTIPPGALTCHDRPDRVHITFNTLVNNQRNMFMQGRTNPMGSTGAVIANNIIVGGPQAGDFQGPMTGATYSGNIIWNTSAGSLGGTTTLNPLLVEDANSVFHLSSGSPAVDRATGTYSYVTEDFDRHGRGSLKDTGADELSTEAPSNRPLSAADVGPNAGLGGTPTPTPTPTATPSTPTPTPTPTSTPGGDFEEITPPASAVTASTSDANVPGNTVDNNLATRWSGNGDGTWLQLDLGSQQTVAFVRVAVYQGNMRRNRFDVQVATVMGAWTTVWSGESSGATTAEETYELADAPARWVRYLGHGNVGSTNTAMNSVTEVSVFRSSAPVVTPTPTATPVVTPPPTPTPTPTPTTPSGPVDVTPPGSAVTASTHDGNVPANTVDNNLATRWSANGDGQWIQYDLGVARTVSLLQIAWYQGNVRRSTFDAAVSDSATGPWTPLVTAQQSAGTTTALETYDVADGTGRYVRITGHGNTVNAWNSVTEVNLFAVP